MRSVNDTAKIPIAMAATSFITKPEAQAEVHALLADPTSGYSKKFTVWNPNEAELGAKTDVPYLIEVALISSTNAGKPDYVTYTNIIDGSKVVHIKRFDECASIARDEYAQCAEPVTQLAYNINRFFSNPDYVAPEKAKDVEILGPFDGITGQPEVSLAENPNAIDGNALPVETETVSEPVPVQELTADLIPEAGEVSDETPVTEADTDAELSADAQN